MLQLGDWVQARDRIVDDLLDTVVTDIGGVGHVIRELEDPEWVVIWFERTGARYTCHEEELMFVCHADAGRESQPLAAEIAVTIPLNIRPSLLSFLAVRTASECEDTLRALNEATWKELHPEAATDLEATESDPDVETSQYEQASDPDTFGEAPLLWR